MWKLLPAIFLLAACAATGEISPPFDRIEGRAEAPTGDKDLSFVRNYVRIAPNIGIGGALSDEGAAMAEDAGFRTLIDLRDASEPGSREEEASASELGLAYNRMTMPKEAGEIAAFMPELVAALDMAQNYPILLHCASGNRAGAAWALYRAEKGVPAHIAIEEGRTAGMKSREAVVRELLEIR